jgi:D-alanine-D-alanine ligase
MNSPKQSGQNKHEKEIWIIYNAWPHGRQSNAGEDAGGHAAEAAVEDEVQPVVEALDALGFPPEVYAISSILDIAARINGAERPKLIFNLAEGFQGMAEKEMNVAALFELFGIPYTGNPARTLALAQDKILTKRILASAGISSPRWTVFQGGEFPDTSFLACPLIAKPSREDASIGISPAGVFPGRSGIEKAARGLFDTYRQPVLIEEFIDGREINAALQEKEGELTVLPLSEILFDGLPGGAPRIISYEAKWRGDSVWYRGTPAACPAAPDADLRSRIEKIAAEVFSLLGGKDYGRVDFRVDAGGKPFVLEYNPNPDISLAGGFVRSLRAAGLEFQDFVSILLRNNHYGGS